MLESSNQFEQGRTLGLNGHLEAMNRSRSRRRLHYSKDIWQLLLSGFMPQLLRPPTTRLISMCRSLLASSASIFRWVRFLRPTAMVFALRSAHRALVNTRSTTVTESSQIAATATSSRPTVVLIWEPTNMLGQLQLTFQWARESTCTLPKTEPAQRPSRSTSISSASILIAVALLLQGCTFRYGQGTISLVPTASAAQIWLGRVPAQTTTSWSCTPSSRTQTNAPTPQGFNTPDTSDYGTSQ